MTAEERNPQIRGHDATDESLSFGLALDYSGLNCYTTADVYGHGLNRAPSAESANLGPPAFRSRASPLDCGAAVNQHPQGLDVFAW